VDFNDNNIGDGGLSALLAISTLKSLNLHANPFITPSGWRSFFNLSETRGIQLVELDISLNRIGDVGVAALGSLLSTNNNTFKTLDMAQLEDSGDISNNVTSQGWVSLFNQLQDTNLALTKLILNGNCIDDQGMELLIQTVSIMSSLEHLEVAANRLVTPIGWQALSDYPQSPSFALEEILLDENEINDDIIVAFTNALAQNKTLKRFSFFDCTDEDGIDLITERGWGTVSTLLCNKTSIMDTYRSNHIIYDACYDDDDNGVASYMYLNENKDKAEVARQKILQTHFSTEYDAISHIQEFLDMELEIMPTAIAWIGKPTPMGWSGKSVSGLSTMYNLMRRLPDLFDSSCKEKPSTGKRKHFA